MIALEELEVGSAAATAALEAAEGRVWDLGRRAYFEDLPLSENPYRFSYALGNAWADGWQEGRYWDNESRYRAEVLAVFEGFAATKGEEA